MLASFKHRGRRLTVGLGVVLALTAAIAVPSAAQTAQSSGGIDGDLVRPGGANSETPPPPAPPPVAPPPAAGQIPDPTATPRYGYAEPMTSGPSDSLCGRQNADGSTYQQKDLIGAAEGVFGTGARGLAAMIGDILQKQGNPDGYIAGREAGGAFAIGLRYGSGTLCQKLQSALPVYWTGPSIGFDAGANAAKTFVLVYNLNDHDKLFRRFGAGEGQAYLVGGFNVSYLRSGNVVLIPVRMGVGLRLGINGGYMKFSRHQNWLPF